MRFNGKMKETPVSQLMSKKTQLLQQMKLAEEDNKHYIYEQIKDIDYKISNLISLENRDKVMTNLQSFSQTDGSVNVNGMWKVKQKLFPKHSPAQPVAKKK